MTDKTTAYLITVGEPEITVGEPEKDGVMSDEFAEALILVGRLIERFKDDTALNGKYIYVTEYILSDDGSYKKQDNLFSERYLIEE